MPTLPVRREELARAQMPHALEQMREPKPDRQGKVRDIYERGDELLLVTTDRVSAFDVVLGTVPFKGALLTEQAVFWLEKVKDVMPTHLLERVDPQVVRVRRAEPLAFELVVRGYLAGSLMREPDETRGRAYGLRLDPKVPAYGRFETPIVTPTTKAAEGAHDEPITLADLLTRDLISPRHLEEVMDRALALFELGTAVAKKRGLILVDTKYEFGLVGGELVLIDEVHTADSSRYWMADSYEKRLAAGGVPEMLDKERLRGWLREEGYRGSGKPPALSGEVRVDLASHYWALTELITGNPFEPVAGPVAPRVAKALSA